MFTPTPATTGTYTFDPTGAEIVLDAFGRCQIRPSEITQSHMFTARMKLNLLLSEWSNNQVNLWEVDLQSIPLVQGTATYNVPTETVMILDMYVTYGSPATDRYLNPLSRLRGIPRNTGSIVSSTRRSRFTSFRMVHNHTLQITIGCAKRRTLMS